MENQGENIELGDWITIHSLEDPVTGDVVYRDNKIIRIKPKHSRSTAIEWKLDENGDFLEEYGVYLVQVHTNSEYYHFAAMIGVEPGEKLEFYTKDGEQLSIIDGVSIVDPETNESSAILQEIIATETEDAILLTNGLKISFQFIGPQPPIAVIVPAIPPPSEEEVAQDQTAEAKEAAEEAQREMTLEELLLEIQPSSMIEEIPTAERYFPDSVQRQEMYSSFVDDLSPDKQKNLRALRAVSQKIEYLLALKQSTVKLNLANKPIGAQKSSFDTLKEVTDEVKNSYIPACVPIYDVKKSIYLDKRQVSTDDYLDFNYIMDVEHISARRTEQYEKGEYVTNGNTFYDYINTLFQSDHHPYVTKAGVERHPENILYDQEAFLAPLPGEVRKGFKSGLTVGYVPKGPFAKDKFIPVTDDNLSTVDIRTGKFLASEKAGKNKGIPAGTISVPADQVSVAGYVMLDTPTILQTRTLTNIPSIMTRIQIADYQSMHRKENLEDLDPISVTESTSDNHTVTIPKDLISQATSEWWTTWVENNMRRTIAPIHGFSPASTLLSVMLDSFVPNRSDFPAALQAEVWKFVQRNMDLWLQANAITRERILKKLAEGGFSGETFSQMIEDPATLNETVRKDTILSGLFKNINERETTLAKNTQVIMNELQKSYGSEAFIQYANIVAILEGREAAFDPKFQKDKLLEIIRANQNRNEIEALRVQAFMSKPEVNSCAHVKYLTAVKKVRKRDQVKYIELFQQFLNKFQGEKKGNWVHCRECKKECVCVHELMLLNEALHPGRALSLHKKLLIEFGGPVFEGNFTCRNCGEGIQSIEYDNSLEYDDEGRPLSGRAVITDDGPKEIDLTEIISKKEQFFGKEEDQKIYKIAKIISERAGAQISDEIFARIVNRAQQYLGKVVPTREQFASLQQTRGARMKGTWEELSRNQQVGIVASLIMFEFQTAKPAIQIKYPFMQCKFSLQGFPTEGLNPETAGSGILDYISCAVAWIYRKEDPWYSTSWGLIPFEEIPKRTKIVKDLIILCTKNLLEKVPLPITSELNNIIKERRESLRLEQSRDLPSKNDRLPTGFTPEAFVTFPPTVQNVPTKGDSYNKVTAMNVSTLDAPKRSLSYRLSVIYGQLKAEAYKKAEKEGLVFSQSERSDSYAAPIELKDLKKGYLQLLGTTEGLENEARDIYYSLRNIEIRIPTNTPCGTHIWTPWSPRDIPDIRVEIPKNILYKLFLRTCYDGPFIGSPHKLGYGGACKNCGFIFPSDEKEGKSSLDTQKVDYSEEKFQTILAAKREKQSIEPFNKPEEPELIVNIQGWMTQMSEADKQVWGQILTIMKALNDSRQGGIEPVRDGAWANFITFYDQQKEELRRRIGTSTTRKARAEAVANAFMLSLDVLTQLPFSNGIDSIMNSIVTPLMQRSKNYKVTDILADVREAKTRVTTKTDTIQMADETKWIKISVEHTDILNKIMAEASELIKDVSVQAKEVAKRAGYELGQWMKKWKALLFEDLNLGFDEKYGGYILRFFLIQFLLDLSDPKSAFYKGLPSAEGAQIPETETLIRETIGFIAENLERGSQKTRMPNEKEIADILLHRTQMENNYVINIFDKLGDEEKAIEKILKKFGIGKWAMGRNVKDYSPELYEHDRNQRLEMGMIELPQKAEGKMTGADFGFTSFGTESRAERGYDNEDHEGRTD